MQRVFRENKRFLNTLVRNRNPVNNNAIGQARKPGGYYLENTKELYENTLQIEPRANHVVARIHNQERNITVLKVSTKDWALQKNLYRLNDRAAFSLLGKILAYRCSQAGISYLAPGSSLKIGEEFPKHSVFIKALTENGVSLTKS
ncbi:39S ribosomal protein L18, mitochondrial [Sergentomyia squamirostris]